MKTISIALLLCASWACAEAGSDAPRLLTATERRGRVSRVSGDLEKTLNSFLQHIQKPNATPSIRDLPNAALALLYLNRDPREAEKLIDMAFDQQDMDPKSAGYGSVPWQIGHPEIRDENAIDFANQAIGPILIHYGDRLSPEFKNRLLPHIKASFASMLRRNLKVSYTNIWLMRATNMVLMGQAIGDAQAESQGYRELDQWIDYTRANGIHEFDSNTYYFVDLDSLNAGYLYAARPEGKAKFKAALDYFWTDIAADYFAPNGTLSGPMSRNYSFLSSSGGVDLYLYTQGFRQSDDIPRPDFEKTFLLETAGEKGYHPDAGIIALANQPVRVVRSRWDAAPGHDRYAYFTPDYCIGSATNDYGAQDKLISVELAGPKLPVVAVVPDVFDSPYGSVKTLDHSGHSKPTHLPYRPVCVQEKQCLLALLDVDASKAPATSTLATNILLPATADRLIAAGKTIDAQSPFEQSVSLESVIGFRCGAAGVAIRVFHVDGCDGSEPLAELKADAAGLKEHTIRYAAYHYHGDSRRIESKHIFVGLLIIADRCEDDRQLDELIARATRAKIAQNQSAKRWDVIVEDGDLKLEASRSMTDGKMLKREVNGQPFEAKPLEVNGADLAGPIWQRFSN